MSARELITEHLNLWTGAVTQKRSGGRGNNGKIELTGIKKLRELILELAVRGKLVEQDPNDEPASMLLERIAEEKARLVRDGTIKKPKKLPEVSEDEKPFDLPNGWQWARLSDVLRVINGRAYKKHEMLQAGTPLLRVGNLFTSSEWYYSDLQLDDDKYIDQGDLIYAWSASFGPFIWDGGRAIYHYHIWKLELFDQSSTNKHFLYNYLKAVTEEVKSSGNGIAMIHMTKAKMEELAVPLPPHEEQQRIVEKVDELMALCDRLEQQVGDQLEAHEVLVDTLLEALTRSADAAEVAESWARIAEHFDTLFTTEASIDKLKLAVLDLAANGKLIEFHVGKRPLNSMLSFGPRNGLSPKKSSSHTGFKVLKLGATTKGRLDLSESKDADIDEPESSHLWLKRGDILIQRGNAASHVGCNVLVEENHPTFIYPDLMMKIRVKNEADPKFISAYLSAPQSRTFMWERMTGTSGTMPKISKKVVEAIPIALPDLEIQKATVEKIDEVMALCNQLKARLGKASETQAHLAEAVVEQAVQ